MNPLKHLGSALPAGSWLALARRTGGLFRGLPGDESKPAWIFALIFFLLAAGIVAASYFYYRSYERLFRFEAERQLSAVAELKVGELAQWRKERLADGLFLFKNASFSSLVRRFLENPEDPDTQQKVRSWLDKCEADFRYDEIRLLDTQGVIRISSPAGLPAPSPAVAQHASEALQSGRVMFLDFYRSTRDQQIHLAILVPILDEADGNRPLGVLVLRIDPASCLYPFIQRWPLPSETAETLLIRREGNEAVFLNELRFQKNTALTLRRSLTNTDVPAVKAALGQEGVVTGRDYRGVPVLAALRAVPDSPWFLVARRDSAEVNAPLRAQLWQVVVMVGILLFGTGAGVRMVWRQQRAQFYRERAKSAEALRESEEKYRTLVTNLSSGVVVHAPDTSVIFSNPMASTLLGLTKDQMRGKLAIDPAWSFLRENGMALPLGEYPVKRVMSSGAPILNQILGIHRPDLAEPVWVQCSAYPDTAVDGTLRQVVVTFSDITERQQANETLIQSRRAALNLMTDAVAARDRLEQMSQALRASEEKYLRAFQTSPYAITITRAEDGGFIDVNDAFTLIAGYTREEALTDSSVGLKLWANEEDRESVVADLRAGRAVEGREYPFRTKSGKNITGLFSAQIIKLSSGPRILSSINNITARKQAEEELRRYRENLEVMVAERTTQLSAANKELEAFSYSVSHDLRAPLRSIDGFSKVLLEEYQEKLDDTGKSVLERVRKATQRMGLLIDDILKLSRITQAEIKRGAVDLSGMVREITEAQQKDNSGRIVAVTVEEGIVVQGDPYLLKIALENLVGNAFKFTGKEAHPRIEFGTAVGDDVLVKSRFSPPLAGGDEGEGGIRKSDGEKTIYFIRDNGAGFDMAYVNKLFSAFQRLHASDEFSGTGIGLATVQRIIDRHGGQVWAEGEVGKGAVFYFTLP